MVGLLKYSISIFIVIWMTSIISCDKMSLEYRLQYFHTSDELDSMKIRIRKEVRRLYDGSQLAHAKWDTLIALDPENEEYYRRKALVQARAGDFHTAYPLLQKAVQLDPFNALYYSGWQMLYLFRDYEKALESFSYYDDINPGVNYISGENINYLKGLSYKQLGLFDQAVMEFDSCIVHEGTNVSEYVMVYRGISNLRNECLAEALSDFDRALSKYENCTMAYVYKGEALINLNRLQEAWEVLEIAEDLLEKGIKKTHPYVEVFDEVQLIQVQDMKSLIKPFTSLSLVILARNKFSTSSSGLNYK